MKQLSESLTGLAARVKKLEDSAAAVREKNRAALQTRGDQLDAAIDRQQEDFEKKTAQATESAREWWSGTRAAIERQNAAMRADFKKRQAALERKSAERAADEAEDDAMAAVSVASYCLDVAEWAVVQAELARAGADELAARK